MMALARAAPAGPPPSAGVDPKTELNQLLQRLCQRPVTKSDAVYVISKFGHQFGHQFQAIIKLNCLQGQEFAGHLSPSPKEAEMSAAGQAIAALPPPAPKAKPAEEDANPAITPKTRLNSLCMRIAKRYLRKGETVYECKKVLGGYQATVRLDALPGEWRDRCWAGGVFTTKQRAEQSAAEIALEQISEDRELSEEAARPKGGGKGAGAGAGGKGQRAFGKGGGWDWAPGWAWQGEPSGPDLPREYLDEARSTGEVLDWRDTYGWIRAHEPVEHPAAQLREGRLYVHRRDLRGELAGLEEGAAVSFRVYVDASGLGAEDVAAE